MCMCSCVCVWFCVCVLLVSHAATVISLSAACFSVRPDSDRDDLTTEWQVVCFHVSRGWFGVSVCVCVCLCGCL